MLNSLPTKYKIIISIALLILQSSCYTSLRNLASREVDLRSQHSLNGYLALEYLQYSRDLSNKYDWQNANYFARKGLRAAQNQEIFPEDPKEWDLNGVQIKEANLAKEKLAQLFYDPNAKQILKPQLAHLQLLYDCWVSKEDSFGQLDSMAQCKMLFFRLEDEINKYLANLKTPKKEIEMIEVKEPNFTRFDVYFDLDLYKFNSKADQAFVKLLKYLDELNGDYKILIVGSADRIGKKLYNDAIARKRALAVKTRLIKNGVPEDLIEFQSLGEESPNILTKEDDQNRNNRVVGVYVLKGKGNISDIPLPIIDNYLYKKEILKTKKQRGV